MAKQRAIFAFGMVSLLAACSGGGSGSSNVAAPASPASQTPVASNGFDASTIAGNIANVTSNKGTYTVSVTGGGDLTLNFTPANITETFNGMDLHQSADTQDFLIASQLGNSLYGENALLYSGFGVWADTSTDAAYITAGTSINDAAGFILGAATDAADVPTMGAASYSGGAAAIEYGAGNTFQNALGGQAYMTADFGNGTVDGTMLMYDQTGTFWGSVNTGAMAITGNSFAGNAITSTNNHSGSASGMFFGSAAEELAGQFAISNATSSLVGAFGASQ